MALQFWKMDRLVICLAITLLTPALQASIQANPKTTNSGRLANPEKPVAPAPATPWLAVAEMEGISEYRLGNGLQVLLFPDPSSATTTVNTVYRVGSTQESYGETGLAHLLEHMLFKGTPQHPNIPQELARRGMRWNASTSYERTNYFSSFGANEKTLDFAISLEADRMLNANIAKADLDSEMSVVRNEFETGEDNALSVLKKRVLATAFEWHAYGRPTIGARADIEGMPIERLQAFYRAYYRPDNATVMVAGQFDAHKTLAMIAEKFGHLPNPKTAIPVRHSTEPTQEGERSVVLRRVGQQALMMAAWHTPAITHPDAAALIVLGAALNAEPGGLLFKRLIENKKTTDVHASITNLRDGGWFSVFAALPPGGNAKEVLATLLETVEGRDRPPLDALELARVKNDMASGYTHMLRSPESVAMLLTESVPVGDWRMVFSILQRIQAVTLADVERVAATYFKPSNRTQGAYIPTEQPDRVVIPEAPAVAEVIKDLHMQSLVAAGEAFEATPDKLEARVKRSQLPSGIRYASLAKQNRGNTVTLKLNVDWGEVGQFGNRHGYGSLNELMFEGTPSRSRQQQLDELSALHATAAIIGSTQGLSITLIAERDTLLAALAVVADAAKNPLLQADVFERHKAARMAELEAERGQLGSLMNQAQRDYLNEARKVNQPWDPRYIRSTDELIDAVRKITLDEVRSIHRDLWAANDARVTVVGSFPDGLEAAIEKHFGTWKKPLPTFKRFTAPSPHIASKRFDVQANDKASAEMNAVSWFSLSRQHADFEPLMLAIHIFGGGELQSRLSTRIRQHDGLSYQVGAYLNANYFDDRATLSISGSFAPENREPMLAAVRQEIERARRDGFTENELTSARHDLLEARRVNRSHDSALADVMQWQLEQGLTFADLTQSDARLQRVTLAQVNAAFQKYIDPDHFVTVVAGDFARKPPILASRLSRQD